MNIVDFMLSLFSDTEDEIKRCLNKATIVVYDGTHILVADNKYIYYAGSTNRKSKSYYGFYKFYKSKMINKILFASKEDLEQYKKRCVIVGKSSNGKYKCIWKG